MRSIVSALVAVSLLAGCGQKEEPTGAGLPPTASAPVTSATATSSARFVDPTRLSEAPTRCAKDIAASASGTAKFARASADPKAAWTLEMTVATLQGASFDLARKPHAFGSVEGEPTLTMDAGRLVVRTAVKFTGDPVATVIVGVRCDGETGLLSVGVRWSDANLDSKEPFEAQVGAVGGS